VRGARNVATLLASNDGTRTALATVAPRDVSRQESRHTMDIEDLHRVVVQGFASVSDRLDSVNARIDSVEAKLGIRIDSVEAKLDTGFAAVNGRIDTLETHMDGEFGRVKDALLEHGRQLEDLRAALDRKIDRDELEARH
jgi:hypothetical protein